MTEKEKLTFNQFRNEQLKNYTVPEISSKTEWQEERAIVQRKAFIEHEIKTKWEQLNR